MRHDRIIDLFGGNIPLAELVGRDPSAVSRWRINGIPARHWPLIVRLARRRRVAEFDDVSLTSLAAGMPKQTVPAYHRRKGCNAETAA
jgi:hypothetical protein